LSGNERNAVIVVFGLDYMVNCGRSEAEGVGMDFCHATIAELMKIRRYGFPILSEGFEGYVLDFIKLLTGLSPRQG
jgi:hypothetical protein